MLKKIGPKMIRRSNVINFDKNIMQSLAKLQLSTPTNAVSSKAIRKS